MNAIAADLPRALDAPLVLIVDDDAVNRLVIGGMLKDADFRLLEAKSGREACEICLQVQPDLVLMDVMMPDMNGMEAAARIKRHYHDSFVPIVFVTAIADEKELLKCIECGGDDFLVKPVSRVLLHAKIGTNLRRRATHIRLTQQRDELVQHQERVQEDLDIAGRILAGVVSQKYLEVPNVRHLLRPVEAMNGDLILAARRPSGDQAFLIGDFTGHGLPAAIAAQVVAGIFSAMAAKGIALEHIASEINSKLKAMLPVGRFLSCCMFDLYTDSGAVRIFNGGMPDVLVRSADGELRFALPSENLPLGIVSDYRPQLRSIVLKVGDRVVAYSDGVIEAHAPAGELFGDDRLRRLVGAAETLDDTLGAISAAMDAHTQSAYQHDDVSLLIVEHREDIPEVEEPVTPAFVRDRAGTWRYHATFNADDLRADEPIARITQVLEAAQGLGPVRAHLFTLMTELYSNALEHGLLDLDSAIKQQPDGFAEYYGARAARLETLQDAQVEISCAHRPVADGGELIVRITHNGTGIPAAVIAPRVLAVNTGFSGRGIGLVQKLCSDLRYENEGKTAIATYHWRRPG